MTQFGFIDLYFRVFQPTMMEDHLPKIPLMASASPTESSGSGGTDDSRGRTWERQERQVVVAPLLFTHRFQIRILPLNPNMFWML